MSPLTLFRVSASHTGKHRLFFFFLALFSPSLCVCSTYNPLSLPRFLLSSCCGDGPRNLTGTPLLEEPSSAALVGSILLWIAARDRIARVSFGRLGSFLILGRGGIWRAKGGAAAADFSVGLDCFHRDGGRRRAFVDGPPWRQGPRARRAAPWRA